MCDSIHTAFLKGQTCNEGEPTGGHQRLKGVRLGGRCGYKRAAGGVLVVMETVCSLTESTSMGSCIIVLQDVTTGENWVRGILNFF